MNWNEIFLECEKAEKLSKDIIKYLDGYYGNMVLNGWVIFHWVAYLAGKFKIRAYTWQREVCIKFLKHFLGDSSTFSKHFD